MRSRGHSTSVHLRSLEACLLALLATAACAPREGADSRSPQALNGGPSPADTGASSLLTYEDGDGARRRITTTAEWSLRREEILERMRLVMGEMPDRSRRVPPDVRILEVTSTPGYERRTISYSADPGDRVPAYLLIPNKLRRRAPALLCLHQTTPLGKDEPAGQAGRPDLHYAHELAERGYVCLVPDYPSFGEYPYDFAAHGDRYASGSMKAIWNNVRGIDVLDAMFQVDGNRIGAIGHSLGGHNALFTAAFDERIKAVVTSCGFTAFHRYMGGDLEGWTTDRYMPRIREVYGSDPARMPFDFAEVLAVLAPRAVFVSAPLQDSNFDVEGVREVVTEARRVYRLLEADDERLTVVYPDAGHAFPDEARAAAYEWLGRRLEPR